MEAQGLDVDKNIFYQENTGKYYWKKIEKIVQSRGLRQLKISISL